MGYHGTDHHARPPFRPTTINPIPTPSRPAYYFLVLCCFFLVFERILSFSPTVCVDSFQVNRIPILLRERNVKLVVIDSIAAIIRSDFEHNKQGMVTRSQVLFKLAAYIKQYSELFHVPFLISNQVSNIFGSSDQQPLALRRDPSAQGGTLMPALGLVWANCVNTRVSLARWHDAVSSGADLPLSLGDDAARSIVTGHPVSCAQISASVMMRRLSVEFSPLVPPQFCHFTVTAEGVQGAGDVVLYDDERL